MGLTDRTKCQVYTNILDSRGSPYIGKGRYTNKQVTKQQIKAKEGVLKMLYAIKA